MKLWNMVSLPVLIAYLLNSGPDPNGGCLKHLPSKAGSSIQPHMPRHESEETALKHSLLLR